MKISVRFTAAIHTLLCIRYFQNECRVTSDFIASSTGVHPVIIRKILLQLQKAGLVETAAGVGGSRLTKDANAITLLDVYRAINESREAQNVFAFHPQPNKKCPIGKNIHRILDPVLESAFGAMEAELGKTTLSSLFVQLPN